MRAVMKIYKNKNTFYAAEGAEYIHRKVMKANPGQIVDHINHNGLDNRSENLRFVTVGQNRQRSTCKPQGKVGYYGVSFISNRYRAAIWHNNTCHYLGRYLTAIEAAKAYDVAAMKFFGEHCKTNF